MLLVVHVQHPSPLSPILLKNLKDKTITSSGLNIFARSAYPYFSDVKV